MKAFNKIISVFITMIIMFNVFSFNVSAKVIEPEIIKTESWTTSYFIDDDIETLYPYIQCEADIYNDGTIKLYMWNTHEWDGFATVQHDIELYNTQPLNYLDTIAQLMINGYTIDQSGDKIELTETEMNNRIFSDRVSTFPHTYNKRSYNYASRNELVYGFGYCDDMNCHKEINVFIDHDGNGYDSVLHEYHCFMVYKKSLPNVGVFSNRQKIGYEFNPTKETDLTKPQQFRLFGHNITITPDLLSGNIVASSTQSTEIENLTKQVEKLQKENKEIKTKLNTLTNEIADVNRDGKIDLADALTTLQYYTRNTLLGENIDWSDLI